MIEAGAANAGDTAPNAVIPSNIDAMAMPPCQRAVRPTELVKRFLPRPSGVPAESPSKTLKNYDSSVYRILWNPAVTLDSEETENVIWRRTKYRLTRVLRRVLF